MFENVYMKIMWMDVFVDGWQYVCDILVFRNMLYRKCEKITKIWEVFAFPAIYYFWELIVGVEHKLCNVWRPRAVVEHNLY
jgi:hypothetical protein